jgi:hypothetical protein
LEDGFSRSLPCELLSAHELGFKDFRGKVPLWRFVAQSKPLLCRAPVRESRRRPMRNFLLAAIALGAAASTGMMPAPALAWDYPFCIKGGSYGSPIGDCSFDTYQQCLATASGRLAFCDANPFFAYATKPRLADPRTRRGPY